MKKLNNRGWLSKSHPRARLTQRYNTDNPLTLKGLTQQIKEGSAIFIEHQQGGKEKWEVLCQGTLATVICSAKTKYIITVW